MHEPGANQMHKMALMDAQPWSRRPGSAAATNSLLIRLAALGGLPALSDNGVRRLTELASVTLKRTNLFVIALAAAALAGCFTADEALLSDANSVAPYERITFHEKGSADASALVRQGKTYVAESEDGKLVMRFMQLDRPGWYVAQVTGDESGTPRHLYMLVKVDLTKRTADTYKAVAEDGDAGPGLRECKDYMVCIDDLDAYITHAEEAVDAGAEPDGTYEITVE